jgi:transcriptional regulator with GAF, ATPase, and Fis domain
MLNELERQSIIRALNETGDNITQAAKTLGMSCNGLKNRIERLEIKITNHC